MKLVELIEKAREESEEFRKAYDYRVKKRMKLPDFQWLMESLESVLGREFVRVAAQAEIDKTEDEE